MHLNLMRTRCRWAKKLASIACISKQDVKRVMDHVDRQFLLISTLNVNFMNQHCKLSICMHACIHLGSDAHLLMQSPAL